MTDILNDKPTWLQKKLGFGYTNRDTPIWSCGRGKTCYKAWSWASHGRSFSCTNSGLSSWGQCPTPFNTQRLTFGASIDNLEKYFPTGPSSGVNGSSSPHKIKTGTEIFGISCTGLGPGGPVTIETNASSAPSSLAGSNIIYIYQFKQD